jgi:hypothetical protein
VAKAPRDRHVSVASSVDWSQPARLDSRLPSLIPLKRWSIAGKHNVDFRQDSRRRRPRLSHRTEVHRGAVPGEGAIDDSSPLALRRPLASWPPPFRSLRRELDHRLAPRAPRGSRIRSSPNCHDSDRPPPGLFAETVVDVLANGAAWTHTAHRASSAPASHPERHPDPPASSSGIPPNTIKRLPTGTAVVVNPGHHEPCLAHMPTPEGRPMTHPHDDTRSRGSTRRSSPPPRPPSCSRSAELDRRSRPRRNPAVPGHRPPHSLHPLGARAMAARKGGVTPGARQEGPIERA